MEGQKAQGRGAPSVPGRHLPAWRTSTDAWARNSDLSHPGTGEGRPLRSWSLGMALGGQKRGQSPQPLRLPCTHSFTDPHSLGGGCPAPTHSLPPHSSGGGHLQGAPPSSRPSTFLMRCTPRRALEPGGKWIAGGEPRPSSGGPVRPAAACVHGWGSCPLLGFLLPSARVPRAPPWTARCVAGDSSAHLRAALSSASLWLSACCDPLTPSLRWRPVSCVGGGGGSHSVKLAPAPCRQEPDPK